MDAKWECDGIHQVQSRGKSLSVGEPAHCFPTNSTLTIPGELQLAEVMSGATYLHELGVVHGDIKGVLQKLVFCLTDRLSRQTSSLTTMALFALQTSVS